MGKLRLTTAQALVKFLDNQYLGSGWRRAEVRERHFRDFRPWQRPGAGAGAGAGQRRYARLSGAQRAGMAHAATGFARRGPAPADYRLHLLHRSEGRPT